MPEAVKVEPAEAELCRKPALARAKELMRPHGGRDRPRAALGEAPDRVGEAEARLRARGVVCPDRFAAMLAPAFG